MSVALGIQQAMHTHLIVICGLSSCTVFSHIVSSGTIKKKIKRKMCLLTFSATLSETCLILGRIEKI
jgi:hypothetical protein